MLEMLSTMQSEVFATDYAAPGVEEDYSMTEGATPSKKKKDKKKKSKKGSKQ